MAVSIVTIGSYGVRGSEGVSIQSRFRYQPGIVTVVSFQHAHMTYALKVAAGIACDGSECWCLTSWQSVIIGPPQLCVMTRSDRRPCGITSHKLRTASIC